MDDLGPEVAVLAERIVEPTDWAIHEVRRCPDCQYEIGPGFQHGRQPQPEGASHVVCSLQRPLRWEYDVNVLPWPLPTEHERGEEHQCTRCHLHVPAYWRHFWPPCRKCAVWSLAGQCLMAHFKLDGHPWLYRGARPWCGDCHGTGFLPCVPQDLSIMRRSGPCATCGAWSFVLFHATKEQSGEIEGSARHYDDVADHKVVVGAAPLVRTLQETFDRHEEAARGGG